MENKNDNSKSPNGNGYWWYAGGDHHALIAPNGETVARVLAENAGGLMDDEQRQRLADLLNASILTAGALREAFENAHRWHSSKTHAVELIWGVPAEWAEKTRAALDADLTAKTRAALDAAE